MFPCKINESGTVEEDTSGSVLAHITLSSRQQKSEGLENNTHVFLVFERLDI
jgi:hypothetical protein